MVGNKLPYDNADRKRLLMQYLRLIPAKFGLINKGAFLHQIKQIYHDDIFIVSYPKSGNTWLRFIIAYIKQGTQYDISFKDLEKIIPDIYTSKDTIDSQKTGRIIKSHNTYFDYYNKTIYIHRDYRDVLISYYFYKIGTKLFSGTFSEFIRYGHISKFGSWKNHIAAALKLRQERPDDCLLLSYESLSENFEQHAKDIALFCGLNTNIDWLKLKEKTTFEALKENENTYGSIYKDYSHTNFFREGKIGVWKGFFSKEDLDYLYSDKELVHFMQMLGYEC